LRALGLSEREAASGLRISLSPDCSAEDLDGFATTLITLIDELS
jgi:cysteine sulfinate desulfinase/cysteine desulfurase-like protein